MWIHKAMCLCWICVHTWHYVPVVYVSTYSTMSVASIFHLTVLCLYCLCVHSQHGSLLSMCSHTALWFYCFCVHTHQFVSNVSLSTHSPGFLLSLCPHTTLYVYCFCDHMQFCLSIVYALPHRNFLWCLCVHCMQAPLGFPCRLHCLLCDLRFFFWCITFL